MHATPVDPPDRLAAAAAGQGVVAWYAQGFSDQLGDRLLLFDNTNARPLELLRLAERLTAAPDFEPALRQRVEQLKPFRHPSFAVVRGVSVLAEPVPQLAVVSDHIPGERLSNILRAARRAGYRPDPGTAVWLLRQLMPAVAALHDMGAEIAHGTLSPDRIVVTPAGDLVITEYVFAHAIDQLAASPGELWRSLGVAVSDDRPVRALDQRVDVEQVALLALAVLLGRPLHEQEYPASVTALLNEACDPGRWSFVAPLRQWLGRALAVDEGPDFETAGDALTTLERLLPRISGTWTPRLLPQNLEAPADDSAADVDRSSGRRDTALPPAAMPWPPAAAEPVPATAALGQAAPAAGAAARDRVVPLELSHFGSKAAAKPAPEADAVVIHRLRRRNAVLGTVALVEAACLTLLLVGRSASPPPAAPVPVLAAGAVPQARGADGAAAIGQTSAISTAKASRYDPRRSTTPAPAATPVRRNGWIQVVAPLELEVYADDRYLGRGRRTRFSLLPGRYVVTLVNDDREIYVQQSIEIVEGEVLAIDPALE